MELRPYPSGHRYTSFEGLPEALDAESLHIYYQHALDQAAIVVITERDGTVVHCNDRFLNISGYTQQEIVGQNCHVLASDEHPESFFFEIARTTLRGDVWQGELACRSKTGDLYWVDTTIVPFRREDGRVDRYVSIQHDVTARKLAEQALAESESRYELAIRGSHSALWDWDVTTNQFYYAPRWQDMFGVTREDLGDTIDGWLSLLPSNVIMQFHVDLLVHTEGGNETLETELEMRHSSGKSVWVVCRATSTRDADGKSIRVAGSLTDVTAIKEAETRSQWAALHDQLTGLPNRELFLEKLEKRVRRCRMSRAGRFAILFFDFDRFKTINDSLGHAAGDALLKSIASRFEQLIGPDDVAARLGGDEFVLLLDSVQDDPALDQRLKELLDQFAQPHDLAGTQITSTASIGVTVSDHTDLRTSGMLLRDADVALYGAKSAGRARYHLFDDQMHEQAVQRLNVEQQMRRAVANVDNEFSLVYQPIVCLRTGATVALEALIRWQHPTDGIVNPRFFIPVAEESGMIVPLGAWVLRTACRQLRKWRDTCPQMQNLSINVNISRKQLLQRDIGDLVLRTLDEFDLSPDDIKLELTESTIMDSRSDVSAELNNIHAAGLKIAMDDFGTGYSSLGCLHEFPLTDLKIDRGFVTHMIERREFSAVVQSIVSLAQHLGLQVVAEGIETLDQMVSLQTMDCQFGQGYFFAKPMMPQQVVEYMRLPPASFAA